MKIRLLVYPEIEKAFGERKKGRKKIAEAWVLPLENTVSS